MLNKCIFLGRFGSDPELKTGKNDKAYTRFSLAVDRDFKGDDGTRATDWVDFIAFGKTAEFIGKYFHKGSMAGVSGRLQINSWQDEQGNKRRSSEVVVENIYFADSKNSAPAQDGVAVPPPMTQEEVHNSMEELDNSDGELPF